MFHFGRRLRCSAVVCLFSAALSAGAQTADVVSAPTPVVARVYVATTKGIALFFTNPDGRLAYQTTLAVNTPIADVATNGKWFYALDDRSVNLYAVSTNGRLTKKRSFNVLGFPEAGGGTPQYLTLDHTGSTLYCNVNVEGDSTLYEAFNVAKTDGYLTWLGNAGNGAYRFGVGPLHILGNNKFAYQTENYLTWFTTGFSFSTNGAFNRTGFGDAPAIAAKPDDAFQPYRMATDPTNHLAVAVYPQFQPPVGDVDGPTQLGVYTADGNGKLSTTSNYKNMPSTLLSSVAEMNMSPSGKYLAVAGNLGQTTGLQLFHFNGAAPMTAFTKLVTGVPINHIHWDNANHLYATSAATKKLYVFTVTATGVKAAPGSPYPVTTPVAFVVRPM